MCYSKESSLNGYILGVSSSVILLNSDNESYKHIGLLFLSISLMQLLEYMIWSDERCVKWNNIASKLIFVVLSMQVIFLFLGGYLFNTLYISNNILIGIICLIVSFLLYYIIDVFVINKNVLWCTKANKESGHLIWANSDKYLTMSRLVYYLSYLIVCLLGKNRKVFLLLLLLFILTLVYSKISIMKGMYYSKWCYYGVMIPVVFIVYEYYDKYLLKK